MELPKIKLNKKPTYIKMGHDLDFYQLFCVIENRFKNCFLLESLGDYGHISRYSIIGFDPQHILSARQETLSFDEQVFSCTNPYYALRKIIPQDIIARRYSGGLIGYLSYDCAHYFEPSLSIKQHPLFDQFRFGVYTDGLVLDKQTQEIFYFYFDTNRITLIQKLLGKKRREGKVFTKFIRDTSTKKEHKKQVTYVKQQIKAGNTFQCEVGFQSEYEISGDILSIYTRLRKINPSPYMYYIKFGQQKIIGASPELLFSLTNGEMETFPLAGTAPRGKNKKEDDRLARELLHNEKETAEHQMLVDLHRSDLGRVAQIGTVKVRSLMEIKKFSHVQHISSEIGGILRNGEDMFSSLAANFPAGTLSGAPKIESMKIIERLEKNPRGPYGGAVGHFGLNGDCTFAIPIRTLFVSGDIGYIQACGGIVADSNPEAEYEEIQNKLAAMRKALTS